MVLSTRFIITFLILTILHSLWFIESSLLVDSLKILLIFLVLAAIKIWKLSNKEFFIFCFFIILLTAHGVVSSLVASTPFNISLNVFLAVAGLFSYLILRRDKDYLITKTFYYSTFLYSIIILIVLLLGRDPNEIWLSSQNTSSQIFVTLGSMFLIRATPRNVLKYKLLFYFIVFAVSVLSIGRSGIISSSILLVAGTLDYYLNGNKDRKQLIFLSFLVLVSFSLFLIVSDLMVALPSYSKFNYFKAKGFHDHYRSGMINEFVENYDVETFFFGKDLSKLPYIASFNNNPHNGFIQLHASLGFLAIVMYLGIARQLYRYVVRKEIVATLALLAMLFRFGTDSVGAIVLVPFLTALFTNSQISFSRYT